MYIIGEIILKKSIKDVILIPDEFFEKKNRNSKSLNIYSWVPNKVGRRRGVLIIGWFGTLGKMK